MRRRHYSGRKAPPGTEEPKLDYGPGYTLDRSRASIYPRSWDQDQRKNVPAPKAYRRTSFAGRGPKTYVRPDERIDDDINEKLTVHPDIDATEVDVKVRAGKVILAGTVRNERMKRLAENVAGQTFGVKEVQNRLRIHRPAAK